MLDALDARDAQVFPICYRFSAFSSPFPLFQSMITPAISNELGESRASSAAKRLSLVRVLLSASGSVKGYGGSPI